jgi:hypothetical protein
MYIHYLYLLIKTCDNIKLNAFDEWRQAAHNLCSIFCTDDVMDDVGTYIKLAQKYVYLCIPCRKNRMIRRGKAIEENKIIG